MAKQVRPRKREPGSHLSFEDVSQIRTFPADSIGASRLIILHQRPDIRQQPDLNMPDIKIILHTWRHPYKVIDCLYPVFPTLYQWVAMSVGYWISVQYSTLMGDQLMMLMENSLMQRQCSSDGELTHAVRGYTRKIPVVPETNRVGAKQIFQLAQ